MSKGLLIIISAPSGGGKTTLLRELRKSITDVYYSISLTTRKPRSNEKEGIDYYFVSEEEFIKRKNQGEFIEYAQVHGFWYGTPKSYIDQYLAQNRIVILDIDVQGGKNIKKIFSDSVLVCIAPPSLSILETRLRSRKQDDEQTIQRRLKAAQSELEQAYQNYDYLIVNDEISEAADQLRCILISERLQMKRIERAKIDSLES